VPSTCGFGARSGEHGKKMCNRYSLRAVISFKGARSASKQQTKPTMKRNLLAVVAAGAIALGGFVIARAQAESGFGCAHSHAFGLRGLTGKLNLTAEQQTKVQPILDEARPQVAAIFQDARQKAQTVIDSTVSQIRPMLTADQQKKLNAIQKAHQDMRNAQKELHNALQD
jgi:Spy/CpxP family protein refolding chaperone